MRKEIKKRKTNRKRKIELRNGIPAPRVPACPKKKLKGLGLDDL
jgi:hypothetical protein